MLYYEVSAYQTHTTDKKTQNHSLLLAGNFSNFNKQAK